MIDHAHGQARKAITDQWRTEPAQDQAWPGTVSVDDVVLGKTDDAGGQTTPLALSDDARERGYSLLFRAPERSYVDARFSVYLRGMVYKGATLFGFFQPPIIGGTILFMILLPIAVFKDVQRQKQLKYASLF